MASRTKIVGRKRQAKGLEATDNLLQLVVELRAGKAFIPRGVYRFKGFEEAQEWTMKMTTRRKI